MCTKYKTTFRQFGFIFIILPIEIISCYYLLTIHTSILELKLNISNNIENNFKIINERSFFIKIFKNEHLKT